MIKIVVCIIIIIIIVLFLAVLFQLEEGCIQNAVC